MRRLLVKASEYLNQRSQRKLWVRMVSALACVVVLGTVYALILPAATLETNVYCGKEEHTHNDNCYESRLTCGQEEKAAHVHTDSCYQEEQTLVCGLEESEEHTHTEECYATERVLICDQEETEGHTHTDACYEKVLACEKEEHVHTDSCYSDPAADVETKEIWEQTLDRVELSGIWAEDVIAVAESQLGYTESTRNYEVDDSGRHKGYTRYGAWYGDPYGDWCAMFVSFCLNYAKIPRDVVPYEANCDRWIQALKEDDMYELADNYTPVPGDIIFFDWDGDESADHVGLVAELTQGQVPENTSAWTVRTIEGNSSNQVQYQTYEITDEDIMGYGLLPENPDYEGEAAEAAESADSAETAESADANVNANSANGIALASDDGIMLADDADGWYYYQTDDSYKYLTSAVYELGYDLYPTIGDDSYTMIFALGKEYNRKQNYSQIPWVNGIEDNYVVAYCAQRSLETAEADSAQAHYERNTLASDGDFTDGKKQQLQYIIEHSYPFISAEEMNAWLGGTSYTTGELLTGTQAAIWSVTDSFTVSSAKAITSTNGRRYVLLEGEVTTGPAIKDNSETNLKTRVVNIANKLLNGSSDPYDGYATLSITNQEVELTENEDGTYTAKVTLTFSREITETGVTAALTDGQGNTKTVTGVSGSSVTIEMPVSTETQELTVQLEGVSTGAMEVYVYHAHGTTNNGKDDYESQRLIGGIPSSGTAGLEVKVPLEPKKTAVDVSKTWDDNNDQDGKRPTSVQVQLYQDGTAYGDPVTLKSSNSWSYTWENLPKYPSVFSKTPYEYTVDEPGVPDEYRATVEGDQTSGYTITNHKIYYTSISVSKQWQDENGDATAPGADSVQVELLANGEATGQTAMLNAENGWFCKWEHLPTTDEDGGEIRYSVRETPVEGYKESIEVADGTSDAGYYWKQVSSMETGHTYLLVGDNGYGALTNNGGTTPAGTQLDSAFLMSGTEDSGMMWLYDSNRYLVNNGRYLKVSSTALSKPVTLDTSGTKIYYDDDYLKFGSSSLGYVFGLKNGTPYSLSTAFPGSNETCIKFTVYELAPKSELWADTHYIITNTPGERAIPVSFAKYSVNGEGDDPVLIAGAELALYRQESAGTMIPGTDVEGTLIQSWTSGNVGQGESIHTENLDSGVYYLVETKPPAGHAGLAGPIIFEVDTNNQKVTVTCYPGYESLEGDIGSSEEGMELPVYNTATYSLPETGGPGTYWYTMSGLLLLLVATLWYIKSHSGKEVDGHS